MIFGGAGDLAHRKLLPALYNLHVDGLLPPRFAVVGVGRSDMTDEPTASSRRTASRSSRGGRSTRRVWQTFARIAVLRQRHRSTNAEAFAPLGSRLDIVEHERGLPGNRIYYLAVPPSLFVPTVKQLAHARFVATSAATDRTSRSRG